MKFSISQIKCFKTCRRAYFFKYIEKLEPITKPDALQVGSSYHELVEAINDNGALDDSVPYSKERAMATAYAKHIYPKIAVKSSEDWFEYPLTDKYTLIGRVDGISTDGKLIEHKTTSGDITEQYEYNLLWDEQLLAYMLATGAREMYYTVCKKPTIRQKKDESDEAFYFRMLAWYEDDTDSKIRLLTVTRTDEEVEAFRQDLIKMCEEIDTATNLYRNTGWCNVWGRRCEYSNICLNYDSSQDYIEFERKERRNGTEET